MGFKLIKQERKKESSLLSNEDFIGFLLEDHDKTIKQRLSIIDLDDNSIPEEENKNKKDFDFFSDEKTDAIRKQAIEDIEKSIINEPQKENEQVVDRRKNRRK